MRRWADLVGVGGIALGALAPAGTVQVTQQAIVAPIPDPGMLVLLAGGLAVLAAQRRRHARCAFAPPDVGR